MYWFVGLKSLGFIIVVFTCSAGFSQTKYSLSFSTYLGGSEEDQARDVAIDKAGNIYVTGGTKSNAFPTTQGAYDRTLNGSMDVFVTKLSPNGHLIWSTFIGGPNYDRAYAIKVDAQGFVYVAGRAGAGFPTTPRALQTAFGGDTSPNRPYGSQDGFVTKLSADGSSVVWSTYVGGSGRDFIRDIDIDSVGNVYLGVSDVNATHPHVTPGAFQSIRKGSYDGFVGKLSPNGSKMLWGSYFGGSGSSGDGWTPSVRVDGAGNLFFLTFTQDNDVPITQGVYQTSRRGGWDMVLAKISPTGQLLASTFFGGTLNEYTETHGLALDIEGNPIIAASTSSTDLPTTVGAYDRTYAGTGGAGTGAGTNYYGDCFIAKLSSDLKTLFASTYLGGTAGDGLEGVGVDVDGNVVVAGATYSANFPITADAYQTKKSSVADAFLARLSPDLSRLLYSTFLGGSADDTSRTASVGPNGEMVVSGISLSTNFPTFVATDRTYKGGADAFLAKVVVQRSSQTLSDSPSNRAIK
jgi:hypothetical protein